MYLLLFQPPVTVCPGESVSLTATSANGSTIFNWYDDLTAGTLLFTGNPYVTTVSATTTFFVESENANGCVSVRTPVVVTVLPNLDVPVATPTPATVCPNESVTLSATSVNGSTIFNWYDDPTAGTLLFTGNPFVTSVGTTTTFYVESEDANGCVSVRTPVLITVLPNLDVPVAVPTPATVCPGDPVSLAATSMNGSTIINWYDDLTAGTLLHTGNPFVTSVNTTTTFYVESESADGCTSIRTPVLVTVLPNLDVPVAVPTPLTTCPGEPVSLSATSVNGSTIFNWFDDPTAGTLLFTGNPFVTSVGITTIFYVESENANGCVSLRTPVTVVVTPNLDIPLGLATPATVCPNESVSLDATSINGSTIFNWYDDLTAGNLLHTGTSYSTSVSATTIFYLESESADGCKSIRTPVTVIVTPNIDVPLASANPVTLCPGDNVELTGTSINGSTNFNWYDTIIDGTPLSTTNPFNTTVNATSIFYVESEDANGCVSPRTSVTVVALPNVDLPVGIATPLTVCPGDTTILSGTSLTGSTVFNWYDDLLAGNLLHTGVNFPTTVSTTTVFYLETENANGCKSVRTPVTVLVVPNLDVPLGLANPTTICPDETVILSATSINGSTVFNWYDTIIAGNALATGQTYSPSVSTTSVFYVESENADGCPSPRTPVTVVVLPNLDIPLATSDPVSICPFQPVTLTATSITGSTIFNWYDAPLGGSYLHTGATYSPSVGITTIFYVESENANGCKSIRTPVVVNVTPNIDIPGATANPIEVCPGGLVTLTANSLVGATVFNWYDDATSTVPMATGQTTTQTVNDTTTYYVETENGNGCSSFRSSVTVNTTPNDDVPGGVANPSSMCAPGQTDITANSSNGSLVFVWYDALTGGTPLFTGQTYSPTVIFNNRLLCRNVKSERLFKFKISYYSYGKP